MNRPLAVLLALAAAIALPAETSDPMQKFVILFRQGPHPLTDADKARRQGAISAWAREQNAAGRRLEPRSLAPSATRPGIAVPPETSGLWPVTALLFLEARDLDDATRVAASHPARDYNASMEVRPWAPPAASTATRITGSFAVKMLPESGPEAAVGRFALDKKYHGPLEATATGEMLAATTATKGSAAYVALEKVAGTLAGRSGTFHLQHTGAMNRGAPSLSITVVPDSGTAGLAGLTGTMTISITADGSHTYTFEYSLPEKS